MCFAITRQPTPKHCELNPQLLIHSPNLVFISSCKRCPGAIAAMQTLYASTQYTPYILTAPSLRNPWSYTEKRVWVEQHLGFAFVERLIICPNKGLLIGDILVDDQISGRGQELFTGSLWQFGSVECPDWSAVCQRLAI
ncbi:MAG: hypothetical protein U5L01_13300 [Rheinheimera sp.]|nr:hypothetical protein [Rheinheimera sp.]